MLATNSLGDMLTTLLDRRAFRWRGTDGSGIEEACTKLLSERGEALGLQQAESILSKYQTLNDEQKVSFFDFLTDALDLDADAIAALAVAYGSNKTPGNFKSLSRACEPQRQHLFRKLNEAPGATAELVRMRADLLSLLKDHPDLAKTDLDLVHLLKSWFNRGFLVLRQINWDSPASILAKIIAYEAVHQIATWDDLRLRLQPEDRRCFAFFHPSMPSEPLIFVEVALTKGVPNSIQDLLSDDRAPISESEADTAVFYSISNCQAGLAGVSFGNSLIKQVARDLSMEFPNLKTFVTLSPIPGLMKWVDAEGIEANTEDGASMERLAAKYLLEAKSSSGLPKDPVARFHLGNGALVHAVHASADLSANGLAQSAGVMVNYLYDLSKISNNAMAFSKSKTVQSTQAVRTLAKRA